MPPGFELSVAADTPAHSSVVAGDSGIRAQLYPPRFRPMWLLLIQVGFVGFLLSLFGLVWRGFDRAGTAQRSVVIWIVAAALFFLLWLLALTRYPVPYPA